MNVISRGHNLDTRIEQLFAEITHPPGPKYPVGVSSSSYRSEMHEHISDRSVGDRSTPFGFTIPSRVATEAVTEVAMFVVTFGGNQAESYRVRVAIRTEKESFPEKTMLSVFPSLLIHFVGKPHISPGGMSHFSVK